MAQLSAVITTSDPEFRSTITTLLRSSGLSIGLIDEKHAGGTWPDLAVVDIRSGTSSSVEAIERLRAAWPHDVDLRRRRLVGARSDSPRDARGRERVSGVGASANRPPRSVRRFRRR